MADITMPGMLLTGDHASRPAATAVGGGTLYACSDHDLIYQSDGATWSTWADVSGGAGGIPATIFDAAGDIIVASAADTAARLAIGAANTVPKSNGTTLAYALPPGHEFDYVEKTTDTTCTATTGATANTVITANAVAYDGSTVIYVEFYTDALHAPTGAANRLIDLVLYDGATELGILGRSRTPANGEFTAPCLARRKLTPSNASHTYSVRGYVSAGTDGSVAGGSGAAGNHMPCYIRQIKA